MQAAHLRLIKDDVTLLPSSNGQFCISQLDVGEFWVDSHQTSHLDGTRRGGGGRGGGCGGGRWGRRRGLLRGGGSGGVLYLRACV